MKLKYVAVLWILKNKTCLHFYVYYYVLDIRILEPAKYFVECVM